jgi:hypothetical protein
MRPCEFSGMTEIYVQPRYVVWRRKVERASLKDSFVLREVI